MPRGNENEGDGGNDGTEGDDRDYDEASGDAPSGNGIYHRQIVPDPDAANRSLLQVIADLEGCGMTDLPPLYDRVDHLVEHLFTSPPPVEAQAELQFSYHGYRIELDQTGNVMVMKLGDGSPVESEN